MALVADDPRDRFCGGAPGEILVGVSPTDEEIVEAQARSPLARQRLPE